MTAAPGPQQPDEVGYSPLVRAAAEFELDPFACSAKVSTEEANLGRDLARWVRARDRRGASRHETEWGLAYLLRAARPAAPSAQPDEAGMARAREQLAGMRRDCGRPARLGCQLSAHRDLGFCASCGSGHVLLELVGWRLLAIADRGVPAPPVRDTEEGRR